MTPIQKSSKFSVTDPKEIKIYELHNAKFKIYFRKVHSIKMCHRD